MDDFGNATEAKGSRTLTDADVEAIAEALQTKIEKRFYQDLGRGIWGLVWKATLGFIVFVAAQGSINKWGS